MKLDAAVVLSVRAERVEVSLAWRAPVDELNAELEGAVARRQEFVLVDTNHVVEGHERRDGGFADSNRADFVRFDQNDFDRLRVEERRESGGGHPAGGAA